MPKKSTKNMKLVEENEITENTADETLSDTNTATNTNRGEIIDIEGDEVRPIFEYRTKLQDMEQYFANMCLQFEKNKVNLMSLITYIQNDLYMMAEQLQKTNNIDENLTYELKLPASAGEKGFFVRKDD